MAVPEKAMDRVWRDHTARNLLRGLPSEMVSGSIRVEGRRFKGWLYIGTDALVFIANQPVSDRGQDGTNGERVVHVTYRDLGTPTFTAPFIGLNGTVEFSNGMAFTGQKRPMKALHKLAHT